MASLHKRFHTKLTITDVPPPIHIWTTTFGDLTFDDLISRGLSDEMILQELDSLYCGIYYDYEDWQIRYDDAYQIECWNTLMVLFPNHN